MGAACCKRSVEENERVLCASNSRLDLEEPLVPRLPKGYESIPNRFSSPRRLKKRVSGKAGLQNIGNTCYINSVLQCLSNCQPLADYFLSEVYQQETNVEVDVEFTYSFAQIVKLQWSGDFDELVPERFVELVCSLSPLFTFGLQHDSQEALAFILDRLHLELNRGGSSPKSDSLTNLRGQELQAAIAWKDYLSRESSVIVDLFQGQFRSRLECTVCGHFSTKFEAFMHLSAELPLDCKQVALETCLKSFTQDESLQDNWFCPRCKCECAATKKLDLWKVPSILMVHLKRFKRAQGALSKNETLVSYPVTQLDCSEFVSGPQKEVPQYALFAYISHKGTLTGGHYTATAKNWRLNKWTRFNDDQVRDCAESDLVDPDAYVLFYHKSTVTEFYRQSNSLPQHWPHVSESPLTAALADGAPPPSVPYVELDLSQNLIYQRLKNKTGDS